MFPPQSEKLARHWTEGNACYARGELEASGEHYRQILAVDPESVPARYNLGVVYRDLEQWESAWITFVDVIARNGRSAEAFNNLALVESHYNLHEAALSHFRRAIALKPQFPDAHMNLGMLLLRLGQYRDGFSEYEWRWQTDQFTPFPAVTRCWNGEWVDGTLLVHSEQGAGDVFQFARFLPLAAERCKRLLFVTTENLMPLIGSIPQVAAMRGAGTLHASEFDAYIALLSLPRVLGTTLENLPREVPYLWPPERPVKFGSGLDAKLKVGLVWSGSPTQRNDRHRSVSLRAFAPLFEVRGVAFYSLQRGPKAGEIADLGPWTGTVHDLGINDPQADFVDTASAVRQLDLTISVCTSVLHLAGALGRPGWGLLAANADWRWMIDREDSPWYPTIRLFRQSRLDDWPELFSRVAAALARRAEEAPAL
jgi:hypothetical protein